MCPTIAISLKSPQLLDCLCASHVGLSNAALYVDVSISLAIEIHLQVAVYLISVVLRVELSLHHIDVLLDVADLLNEVASVAIDAVKLLEHQIQTFLQGGVV